MSASGADGTEDSATFDRLLGELRPKLHRYCARMTGSVIDGEDVVQEALVKAIKAYPQAGPVADLEGWLFRIAHNAALDFLRRRARQEANAGPRFTVNAGLSGLSENIFDPAIRLSFKSGGLIQEGHRCGHRRAVVGTTAAHCDIRAIYRRSMGACRTIDPAC